MNQTTENHSEQTETPAVASPKKPLRERDRIDWTEFWIGIVEVFLTLVITGLIVYEVLIARHQDALASRTPEITFSQNSFSIQVVPLDVREHPIELSTPEVGTIFNQGHAALVNGSVVAYTDQQDVKITCTEANATCRKHVEPLYVGPGVDFDLGTLAARRGIQINFTVTYMSDHKPFKKRLMVSGDNIEVSKIMDLTIDPTMLPPEGRGR